MEAVILSLLPPCHNVEPSLYHHQIVAVRRHRKFSYIFLCKCELFSEEDTKAISFTFKFKRMKARSIKCKGTVAVFLPDCPDPASQAWRRRGWPTKRTLAAG